MHIVNRLSFIVIISFLLLACNSTTGDDRKPVLSVSIEPQRYFLEALVGDKYDVNTVIPLGSNPESFDPSPSQMVKVGKSAVYYKVGKLGFENTWLKNIQYNNPEMVIVDCSQGIKTIQHNHEEDHHDHTHPNGDPHIWSSTNTALVVAQNMYNSLIQVDKENKTYYLDNLVKLERKINQTDSLIRNYISQAPSKSFIVYHPALSYFADEYGLNQLTIEVDGKTPTPKQLSKLIKEAKKDGVKVVFVQAEFDRKNTEVVAKEIGAEVIEINPLVYDWDHEMIKIAKALALQND